MAMLWGLEVHVFFVLLFKKQIRIIVYMCSVQEGTHYDIACRLIYQLYRGHIRLAGLEGAVFPFGKRVA